jgi:hypothetical protein
MGGYMVCKFLNHRLAPAAIAGFFAHFFADLPVEIDDFSVYRLDDPFFGGPYEGENIVEGCRYIVMLHIVFYLLIKILSTFVDIWRSQMDFLLDQK